MEFERFTLYTSEHKLEMSLPDFFQIEFHLHFDPYAIQLPSIVDLRIAEKRKIGYDSEEGDQQVSGQLNVVFCTKGVVVYRFDPTVIRDPDFTRTPETHYEDIYKIMNKGNDRISGICKQIEEIEAMSKFKYSFTSWGKVKESGGVDLGKFCLNEIVKNRKPIKLH